MKNKSLCLFISWTLKLQQRSQFEMPIFSLKNLRQFRLKTRYFSSEGRRRKTISDLYFLMNVMSSTSKPTKFKSVRLWTAHAAAISWRICIENLSLRLKILFMRLEASILMRRPKNVKCMIFPRTNGQKSATLNNQGTTILWQCWTRDIFMLSVEETAWMKRHWRALSVLMASSTSTSKSGSSSSMSISTTCGPQETL